MTGSFCRGSFVLLFALGLAGCPGGKSGSDLDAGPDLDASGDSGTDAGPCVPVAGADEPDAMGVDSNCDGIDGDESLSIFVAATGIDASTPTSGTRAQPVHTISFALSLAETRSKTRVLVASGTYLDQVTVVAGREVHGGYDATNGWTRNAASTTTVVGSGPVLSATGIATTTRFSRLSFEATDATSPSASSYGARLVDSDGIVLEDVVIKAGRGGDGAAATPASTAAADGGPGGNGPPGRFVTSVASEPYLTVLVGGQPTPNFTTSILWPCGQNAFAYSQCLAYSWSGSIGAGAAGVGTCACTDGGAGGLALNPTIAQSTSPARTARGGVGASADAPGATCTPSQAGAGGAAGSHDFTYTAGTDRWAVAATNASLEPAVVPAGTDGTPGALGAGGAPASFVQSGFVPESGTTGSAATNGRGGAGGGGGYGTAALQTDVTAWITATGGAGGGGGAGGCGGAGGGAGGGGGASVGLYLWNSHPTLIRVVVQSDMAGIGGAGAPGQVGGSGGTGGMGGAAGIHPNNANHVTWQSALSASRVLLPASAGAMGGQGGSGGTGGGGGGGTGGTSAAVVLGGGAALNAASTGVSLIPGNAGVAGSGGALGLEGASGQSIAQLEVP